MVTIMNKEALGYYQNCSQLMKNFCKPLDNYFGIPLVVYFKAFHRDDSYILLSNDENIVKNYCSTIEQEVLYATDCLHCNSKYKLILWPDDAENHGSQIYIREGYWHGFTIIHQYGEEFECFCFLSKKDNPAINEFFVKHYHVLEKFTEHFKAKFGNTLLLKSLSYKTKYKHGCDFYIPEEKTIEPLDIHHFLQVTNLSKGVLNIEGKFIPLTQRETECLRFVNEGLSLKGIANKLLLSPKTIEVHLNNIKNKTGYHNRSGLVRMCRESFLYY